MLQFYRFKKSQQAKTLKSTPGLVIKNKKERAIKKSEIEKKTENVS